VQRDPAGLTPMLEMRVIEATELTMQRKASDATIATQAALLELNQLRGVAAATELAVNETPLVFRPAESRETLLASARTNNFELRARAVELAQQGFRVDLAKNERFPSVSIGPTISEENAGDRERIIGVGVSLPLPLWNRNNANIEAAVARQTQAQTSLDVAMREVERKIVEAAMTYEAKLREMSKWQPDSVRHFREAAELADRHYRLGAVPISTYVELQKQYLETVESLLGTKKEALELAQQLELLTGLPAPLSSASAKEEGAMTRFIMSSVTLLATLVLVGCQPKSANSIVGESTVAPGPQFSAKKGLLLPEETRQSLGMKMVEVEEQKITATIDIQLRVYEVTKTTSLGLAAR
jgi:cobalt-zinc-cadmium efflux system outer membrane protein